MNVKEQIAEWEETCIPGAYAGGQHNPRGRIVSTHREIQVGHGITFQGGTIPLITVYVKNSKRFVKDFFFRCTKNGIGIEQCSNSDRLSFIAWGTPESLEALTCWNCIIDWHYSMNVQPPRSATGTGPDKRVKPEYQRHPDYKATEPLQRNDAPHRPPVQHKLTCNCLNCSIRTMQFLPEWIIT